MEYLVRTMAISALVMIAPVSGSMAQTANDPDQRMTLHIDGLTSNERDAIAIELSAGGEFRISYACVPAGILVIERIGTSMQEIDRSHAEAVVRGHIAAREMTTLSASQTDLEAECMTTRDQ